MEAHFFRVAIIAVAIGSMGASQRSANFIVTAPTPEMATQILNAAEAYRRDLAMQWLGKSMPNWSAACPIDVHVAPHLGAGGATSFLFENGEVYGWQMTIQGSLERVLDSVLPHEITHTIFATHFRRPLPRWADEGACTTVEHVSEKTKQQIMLVDFLRTNRGIPFSQMFVMKEYPRDVMPLYSQGYSLARYLIAQGGRPKFIAFLADGMQDENWPRAIEQHYSIPNLAVLQNTWLEWVRQGSPAIERTAPEALASAGSAASPLSPVAPLSPAPESGSVYRGQNGPLPGPAASVASAAPAPGRSAPADQAPLAKLVDRDRDRASAPVGEAGWHSPRRELASYEPASDAPSAGAAASAGRPSVVIASERATGAAATDQTSHQATRQQPVQQSRQIILEWSRPLAASPPEPIRSGDRRMADGGTVWR
jgi:hypothetical protein